MKVVVGGAGILGGSTAYHLAREGSEVALVGRADEGRTTAAGAGVVCPWGSPIEDASSYALLARGARYYPQIVAMLAEDRECDLGYAQVGGFSLLWSKGGDRCDFDFGCARSSRMQ